MQPQSGDGYLLVYAYTYIHSSIIINHVMGVIWTRMGSYPVVLLKHLGSKSVWIVEFRSPNTNYQFVAACCPS